MLYMDIYGVPWIPSIYPLYVSIYTSTMDPSWVGKAHPDPGIPGIPGSQAPRLPISMNRPPGLSNARDRPM